MSPYLTLFGKEIPLYGVLFFVGVFAAALCAIPLCKKRNIEKFDLACSAIYTMIAAIVGAKLLFIIVSAKQIFEMGLGLESIIKGGFVFYGGMIGGAIGNYIYTRQYHLSALNFFDLYATILPLGHAFGRIGCFVSGCCYGMPHDGFLSYTYTYSMGDTPVGIPLLPIQLFEAVFLLLLFDVTLVLYIRFPKKRGLESLVYLIAYPIFRFIIEFFRGDAVRGGFLGLSTSQWISIALLICAAIYAYLLKRKKKTA